MEIYTAKSINLIQEFGFKTVEIIKSVEQEYRNTNNPYACADVDEEIVRRVSSEAKVVYDLVLMNILKQINYGLKKETKND